MNKYFSNPQNKSDELIAHNFRDLGIFNLKASASAQFNEEELKNIIEKYPHDKITIVDLRLEYHGFINGIPMTFRNHYPSSTTFDSSQEKNILIELVNNKQFATETLKYYSKFSNITEINYSLTEEQLSLNYHCSYQRFPLKDHHFPTPQQFASIVDFLNEIEKDPKQRIHVHCAAGRGRTAIFLVIYDIFKNHKFATIEQIFTRQAKLGGANLANIAYEDEWPNDQKQNIQMLYDFYEQLNQS